MKNIILLLVLIVAIGCTNMNKTGEATTPEGTIVNDRNNADKEDERTGDSGDSIVSPGSNSTEIRKDGKGNLNGSNDNK